MQTIEQAIGYEKFRTLYSKDAPENIVMKRWDMIKDTPHKSGGVVEYYFKAKNKYPARIYVFMHAEQWRPRNRGAMALRGKFPFLSRPMTEIELLQSLPETRLPYFQYEDWNVAASDEKEVGSPEEFIAKLLSFKNQYKLQS